MKKNIYLMYAISFLQGMVFYASISTLYRQAWGVTVFQIMVIESISMVLGLVLEVPWGVAADKIGYKKTMILCSLLYAVSKVIFWQARGFGWFLGERILLAFVTSGLSGVDSSILYLSCKEGESQKVFGIFDALGTAGMILATLIFSAFIGENYPLTGFMTVLTYSAAAILPFFLTEVKDTQQPQTAPAEVLRALKQTLRDPVLLTFLIGSALMTEMQWAVTVMLNQVQYERCGIAVSSIGLIYILQSVLELSPALSETVTRWLGEGKTLLSIAAVSLAACTALGATKSATLSVACIMVIVVAWGLFGPLVTELKNRQVHSVNRATMLSIFAIITNCVGVCTNLAFGMLADWNVSMTFFFGAVVSAAGFVLLALWNRAYHKKERESL